MNQLKRFSLALCLTCIVLISTVSAQVGPVTATKVDDSPSGTIAYRAGCSWAAADEQLMAEFKAYLEAWEESKKARFELIDAGYKIIGYEHPEVTNSRWYGDPYGWGAHACWSITAVKLTDKEFEAILEELEQSERDVSK